MKKRNPIEVTQQILNVVLEESPFGGQQKELEKELNKLINDFSYKAPEMDGECFFKLSEFCNLKIANYKNWIVESWRLKIISILTNKTKDEILEIEKNRR